jgi:peptidoglycan/xylan/chitin deacetylase (PgdA/CDA1 family)
VATNVVQDPVSSLPHPRISVIIPARNSALTLAATLDSLIRQTATDWEAIIIDDGSTDRTYALASGYAERDPRLSVIRQAGNGVSAARNAGLTAARADWVLFLDADDRLDPSHLTNLLADQARSPHADVIYGGWRAARPQGFGRVRRPPDLADAFSVIAVRPPFVVHAALTRRSRLQQCGGFDESLTCAEGWDLWQRIARTGASFAPSRTVARYTLRADSPANDMALFLRSGLEVIERGHSPDPRVVDPAPAYAQGAPRTGISRVRALFSLKVAGSAIAAGQDHVLPQVLAECRGVPLDPEVVAVAIAGGMVRSTPAESPTRLQAWSSAALRIAAFLEHLEADQPVPRLARRTLRRIEVMLADSLAPEEEGVIGGLQVVICERSLTTSLRPADEVERVRIVVPERDGLSGRLDLIASERFDRPRLNALFDEEFGLVSSAPPRSKPVRRIQTLLAMASSLPASASLRWAASARPAKAAPGLTLVYRRIADDEGATEPADHCVSPQRFSEHMRWLAEGGYTAVSLPQLETHLWEGVALPRRSVLISFDGAGPDLLTQAAPTMRRHNFTGAVFLVTDEMGRSGADKAARADRFSWAQAKALRDLGWTFGAKGARRMPLTGLTPEELRRDLRECRQAILSRLGGCGGLAYPFDDVDEAVSREAYAAGFRMGFTRAPGRWRRGAPVMTLPRLSVRGDWSADDLGAAIGRLA